MRRSIIWCSGFVLLGLALSALTLAHSSADFCTTTYRGWPCPIIVYPCLCWGRGEVGWILNPSGLLLDVAVFTILSAGVFAVVRLLYRHPAVPFWRSSVKNDG